MSMSFCTGYELCVVVPLSNMGNVSFIDEEVTSLFLHAGLFSLY